MKGHAGKVAVVTGAAQGIGRAYAARLAAEGVDVACVDLNPASETVMEVGSSGRKAISYQCDVSSPEDVEQLARAVEEDFGGCDILVNNAGIYPVLTLQETDWAAWRRLLSVNLDGAFLISKAFLPCMQKRGWGRIVNQSSGPTNVGVPGFVAYTASKSGLVGLTRALATEVAEDGITVNCIAPSLVKTPSTIKRDPPVPSGMTEEEEFELVKNMQPIKRTQVPEDLCGALAFLTSDEAAFITAQTYYVDGGWIRV